MTRLLVNTQNQNNQFCILLYYQITPIADYKAFAEEHEAFCQQHNLKGRIIITPQGINGTCAGTFEQTNTYKAWLSSKKGFEDVFFKQQDCNHIPFPKLQIMLRDEVVTFQVGDLTEKGGKHISPKEFHNMWEHAQTHEDTVFVDMRSVFEAEVGTVKGAIVPDIQYFRQLPKAMPELAEHKEKKVVMFCTGGIRCELASKYFKEQGFEDVYQLDGGIYNYCSQYPDGAFEGACYVFDDRKQIMFDKDGQIRTEQEFYQSKVITKCAMCGTKTSRLINDERNNKRLQLVCCEKCDAKHDISRVRSTKVHPQPKLQPQPKEGKKIGRVTNYYAKAQTVEIHTTQPLGKQDTITVAGWTTGLQDFSCVTLKVHEDESLPDTFVYTLKTPRLRKSDIVYLRKKTSHRTA